MFSLFVVMFAPIIGTHIYVYKYGHVYIQLSIYICMFFNIYIHIDMYTRSIYLALLVVVFAPIIGTYQ
jgi:hypothetical protein